MRSSFRNNTYSMTYKEHVYLMLENLWNGETVIFRIRSKADRQLVQDAVDDMRDYKDLVEIMDDDKKHFTIECGKVY